MGIVVKRPVRLIVIVTEQFKTRRAAEIRAALARLDVVKKRLDMQLEPAAKRAEAGSKADALLGERLRAGLRRNEQTRDALSKELQNVSALEIGIEHERGVLEGTVEVEVGDDISRFGACEIVVRDDKVVEIRDGICPGTSKMSS